MEETTPLRKLQLVELEILKEFIKIANKNNINYYIVGGTLLGAVRHKGFIPWDDDMDIAVPRPEYKKLIEIMRKENNEILGMNYYKDNNELYYYPIKLVHKKHRIKEPRTKEGYANPWIDVFPIDGKPNSKIKSYILKFKMLWYKMLLGLHYVNNLRDIKRKGYEKVIIKFGQITHIGKLINPTKIKDKMDKTLEKNDFNECREVGDLTGAYFFREFVPKEYFGKGSKVQFEDIEVNAPDKPHEYLEHIYGEYMTPPPKEEQKLCHNVEFLCEN